MNDVKLEKEYYPNVEKWLKNQYLCFETKTNIGTIKSRADVVGLRDVGGDFSGEIETIIIEVKRDKEAFATASGQAFGYTIYGNRVYLADIRNNGFTQDEIMIANHIGVGLIQIDNKNKCHEILTSPYYNPIKKFNMQLIYMMNYAKCQFCDHYFQIGNENNRTSFVAKENIDKAIKEEKGLLFWNRSVNIRKQKIKSEKRNKELTYERRFLCNECIELLFNR